MDRQSWMSTVESYLIGPAKARLLLSFCSRVTEKHSADSAPHSPAFIKSTPILNLHKHLSVVDRGTIHFTVVFNNSIISSATSTTA